MVSSKLPGIANSKHMTPRIRFDAVAVAANICLHLLLFCSLSRAGDRSPPACATLSQQDKEAAADLIYTQFGLSKPVAVADTWQVSGTCYTRLHLRVKETNEDVAQDFYLAPDHRFLSFDLFDVGQFSPAAELAARSALRAELMHPASAVLGNRAAKVLISFFTDLQCPYCREQEEVLTREILPLYRDKIAIVFHHRPIETHSWSVPASEALSCIQTRAPAQFWPLAKWVLENQTELSPETATAAIISRAALHGPDMTQLEECAAGHLSDAIIKRDQALAKDLSIMSTPTTFVEGRRFVGAVSSVRLQQAIEAAMSH